MKDFPAFYNSIPEKSQPKCAPWLTKHGPRAIRTKRQALPAESGQRVDVPGRMHRCIGRRGAYGRVPDSAARLCRRGGKVRAIACDGFIFPVDGPQENEFYARGGDKAFHRRHTEVLVHMEVSHGGSTGRCIARCGAW